MMSAKIGWPTLFSENLCIEGAHKCVGDAALFFAITFMTHPSLLTCVWFYTARIAYLRFTSALRVLF